MRVRSRSRSRVRSRGRANLLVAQVALVLLVHLVRVGQRHERVSVTRLHLSNDLDIASILVMVGVGLSGRVGFRVRVGGLGCVQGRAWAWAWG